MQTDGDNVCPMSDAHRRRRVKMTQTTGERASALFLSRSQSLYRSKNLDEKGEDGADSGQSWQLLDLPQSQGRDLQHWRRSLRKYQWPLCFSAFLFDFVDSFLICSSSSSSSGIGLLIRGINGRNGFFLRKVAFVFNGLCRKASDFFFLSFFFELLVVNMNGAETFFFGFYISFLLSVVVAAHFVQCKEKYTNGSAVRVFFMRSVLWHSGNIQ